MTIPKLGRTVHLGAERAQVGLSNEFAVIAEVATGTELTIALREPSDGQITRNSTIADVHRVDGDKCNPATGLVRVDDAKPGDVLQVDLLAIEPADWAWTVQAPGLGLLPTDFHEHWLHIWSLNNGFAEFVEGVRVPLEPFCGVIAVAPAEPGVHSDVPRSVGGNIDIKHARAGSTIYLPVEVEGALFSIGDPHGAQGDGEVCGSAVECAATVTVRLSVRRDITIESIELDVNQPLERPSAARWGYHVTTGVAPDLMEAARQSIRRMIDHLHKHYSLAPQDAYALCSVAVDLKISEIVDAPNWIVSAFLPKDLFH